MQRILLVSINLLLLLTELRADCGTEHIKIGHECVRVCPPAFKRTDQTHCFTRKCCDADGSTHCDVSQQCKNITTCLPPRCGENMALRNNTECQLTCNDIKEKVTTKECVSQSKSEKCGCIDGHVLQNDICISIEQCLQDSRLDLAFVLDGSSDVDPSTFMLIKSIATKTLERFHLSRDIVRAAIIIYGREIPYFTLLRDYVNTDKIVGHIDSQKQPGGSSENVISALHITHDVIIKPEGGARHAIPSFVFVVKASRINDSSVADYENELGRLKVATSSVVVISLDDEPQSDERYVSKIVQPENGTDADPSTIVDKLQEITRSDRSCPKGYETSNGKCVDMDECLQNPCEKSSVCINIPGIYKCYCLSKTTQYIPGKGCISKDKCDQCQKGYQKVNGTCVDLNECDGKPCKNGGTCTNSIGGYDCVCKAGYVYTDIFGCIDVNECKLNIKPCSGKGQCKNTVGSYSCVCELGYTYKEHEGCVDINECARNGTCGEPSQCENIPGGFKCVCKEGYEYKDNTCKDVDECSQEPAVCKAKAKCVNEVPGYKCTCKIGFIYDADEGCQMSKEVERRQAHIVFVVDAGDNMEATVFGKVKTMMSELLKHFNPQVDDGLRIRISLVILGGKTSDAAVGVEYEDATKEITSLQHKGGEADLVDGLKHALKIFKKDDNSKSSNIVYLITATSLSTDNKKVKHVKKHADEIKRDGTLIVIEYGKDASVNKWRSIMNPEELEKYVIIVKDANQLQIVDNIVFKISESYIACPNGYVMVGGNCKVLSKASKYCKFENQLRLFNTTWTSKCMTYNCTENGVGIMVKGCMDAYGHCFQVDSGMFFPCYFNGEMTNKCRCLLKKIADPKTGLTVEYVNYQKIAWTPDDTITTQTGRTCTFPYFFEKEWFYGCTMGNLGRRWCSEERIYRSRWSYCKTKEGSHVCKDPYSENMYQQEDTWKYGCNILTCDHNGVRKVPRCKAFDGTCVDHASEGYACIANGKRFSSCICLTDHEGLGANEGIGEGKGKRINGGDGKLVTLCTDVVSGKQYELGITWQSDCITYNCTETGGKTILQQCDTEDGKCVSVGSTNFRCKIFGVVKDDCECIMTDKGYPTTASSSIKTKKKHKTKTKTNKKQHKKEKSKKKEKN